MQHISTKMTLVANKITLILLNIATETQRQLTIREMKEVSLSQVCQTWKKVQAVQYKKHRRWKSGNKTEVKRQINFKVFLCQKQGKKSRMKGLQACNRQGHYQTTPFLWVKKHLMCLLLWIKELLKCIKPVGMSFTKKFLQLRFFSLYKKIYLSHTSPIKQNRMKLKSNISPKFFQSSTKSLPWFVKPPCHGIHLVTSSA